MKTKHVLTMVVGLLFMACSHPPEIAIAPTLHSEGRHSKVGSWGFDLAGMDTSILPGDDFYRYANGKWMAATAIPPDLTEWGTVQKLSVDTQAQVHDLVEELPSNSAAGSPEQKVRDFYRSFLDVEAIERAGLDPAQKGLVEIAAVKNHRDVARLMGRADLGIESPLNIGVKVDEKDPNRYIVGISQAGLSLPDRDYYLQDDPVLGEIRKKFLVHLERMLRLGGSANANVEAKVVFDVESQIARRHWPAEKRRERELTNNLRTRDQLDKLAGNYPWTEILAARGLQEEREFVIAELDAVQAIVKFFTAVPLDAWRSYMRYHYLVRHASVLPKAIDAENFDFYGHTLNGTEQQRERWKRAVSALQSSVGEVVGQVYVKKYFPAESKQLMLDLVNNVRGAYARRIQSAPWLSEVTKKAALAKLDAFRLKIGYPDRWKDYSSLEIRNDDAFGNAVRGRVFNWNFDRRHLGKKTDREEWFMTPQTVNAYYNDTFNEIVFPAAILQPPLFDPNADPAVNYGAIGAVIGHEMGHGFDDQGSKSDAQGVLRTWWQSADEEAFKKLVDAIVQQYSGYDALPGLKLNGRLTAGENIGDLGGLVVAYEAYLKSLNGKEPPLLDGLTGKQRFFLGDAQAERAVVRDAALRARIMSDSHSPNVFRINGVVRNVDAWYEAFGVKADTKLYLSPEQRVKIW